MKVIVSQLIPNSIKNELSKLVDEIVCTGYAVNITNETAYHPDMLLYKLTDGNFISANQECFSDISKINIKHYVNLREVYPNDCVLNCFRTRSELICGKNTNEDIVKNAVSSGFNVIYVKQGYAACSTVEVNEDAYISSDVGIVNALKRCGYDTLLVENDGIYLNGYGCGFIGGSVLMVSNEIVAFSGKVSEHKDFNRIKSFCNNYHVNLIELSNNPLYDYGGFHTYN